MNPIFEIVIGISIWFFTGVAALAAVDDDKHSLLEWASECPLGGATFVILVWPWVLYWLYRNRNKVEK